MKLMKYIVVLVALSCTLIVAGCRTSHKDGLLRVHKGLRLYGREIPFPSSSNGVIKIAIQPSPTGVKFAWHSFEVVEGAITIHGRNGTFRIEQGNAFTVDIEDFGRFTGKLNRDALLFDLDARNENDDSQKLRFTAYNWGWKDKYPVPSEYSSRKGEYWYKVNPLLYSVASNGWCYIEIPYGVSADFQGNLGRLKLGSNWYEY